MDDGCEGRGEGLTEKCYKVSEVTHIYVQREEEDVGGEGRGGGERIV